MGDPVADLRTIAPAMLERLEQVLGVEGVALGGSRAQGTHHPTSDYDLGLYYGDDLDVTELQALADDYSTVPAEITEPGGWGPWVDGGGWLVIGDVHVDVIYRDVDRVEAVWADCCEGRYINAIQAGHPLGFWSHAYAGELALCRPIGNWPSRLSELRAATVDYPDALDDALAAAIWESSFSIANARKAADRSDVAFVAGCLFRAAGVMTQAMHGHARQWLVNEKGAIASSATLPSAPPDLEARVASAFARLGPDASDLTAACDELRAVVDDVASVLDASADPVTSTRCDAASSDHRRQ
jgi:predicted nucleotidyltransferase